MLLPSLTPRRTGTRAVHCSAHRHLLIIRCHARIGRRGFQFPKLPKLPVRRGRNELRASDWRAWAGWLGSIIVSSAGVHLLYPWRWSVKLNQHKLLKLPGSPIFGRQLDIRLTARGQEFEILVISFLKSLTESQKPEQCRLMHADLRAILMVAQYACSVSCFMCLALGN